MKKYLKVILISFGILLLALCIGIIVFFIFSPFCCRARLISDINRSLFDKAAEKKVITAKEISLLDLRDADLVVLSACETGTGEITSEGVFGLQRAFKMAGAQTIIMFLWPVHDQTTQLLMTEFYRNWITNHQSKREAFRNAQNTVRSQYEEPVYWAGFIMLD